MTKPQVVVSGGTGFIGQHIVPLLLKDDFEVVVIGRDGNKAKQFHWHSKVEFISCDYHREELHFKPKPDASLIHLAWQGLPNYDSLFHIEENLPKNFEFIKRLVDSGVTKILAVGTCLEYGLQYGPLATGLPAKPGTPYAIAKDRLRQKLSSPQTKYILQWARLFYMYGVGQNSKSILAQLDAAIDRDEPVFNMSGGEQLRDYLPVEEVANQLLNIFNHEASGVFNVCSGEPISIRRLVERRIKERNASIRMNLGYYPYTDFEPMAFWGKKQ